MMRLGITARLALWLGLIGMLASGITGLYAYHQSRALLVEAAQQQLLTSTRVLARRITLTREEISRNLLMIAQLPAAAGAARGNPADEAQLATLFRALLTTHPSYFQLRLISAADFGLERVRIDRHGDALVQVTGAALQEKGHYPYVAETLQLPAGATYLSRITINHEVGSHAGLDQPVLQLAMPVMAAQGPALGVVVVNVDLDGMFALLAADLPPGYRLYLANREGDVLVHPDPAKTFGFDKGRRVLVQDEFPPTAALVSAAQDEVVFETDPAARSGTPLVAAFIGQKLRVPSSEGRLMLGLAQPLDQVLSQSSHLAMTIARMVLGLSLAGLLLALPLARALTRDQPPR